MAGECHIRVAVGRDHADAPPTRGVFKGTVESALSVVVQVKPSDEPDSEEFSQTIAALSQSPDPLQQKQQQ